MTPIVSVRELRKSYGHGKAVDAWSSTRGTEIFALLGPTAPGRHDVEILEGLRKPTAGPRSWPAWMCVKDPSCVEERIGVQLQHSAFPENFVGA